MDNVKNEESHRYNVKNYTIHKHCFKLYKTDKKKPNLSRVKYF